MSGSVMLGAGLARVGASVLGAAVLGTALLAPVSARAQKAGEPHGRALAASAAEHARRLAEQLHDESALLELVLQQASQRDVSRDVLESVVRASEGAGKPEQAITVLSSRIERGWDDGTSAGLLAPLLVRTGRPAESARVWARLAAHRGASGLAEEEALAYARVMACLDDPEGAHRALLLVKTPPPPASHAFWTALSDVSWQIGNDRDGERASQVLWDDGQRTPEILRRLFLIARARNDLPRMGALARTAFRDSERTEFLLDVASLEADASAWEELGKTLQLADSRATLFERSVSYWTVKARWLAHEGDRPGALAAAEQAADLRPDSGAVVAQLLWTALENDGASALEKAVKLAKQSHLERAPLVTEPLGLGLLALGRPGEALALWDRPDVAASILARSPDALADAFASAGRAETAAEIRQAADRKVLRGPARLDLTPDDEGRDQLLRFGDALRRQRGVDAEARWLRRVLAGTELRRSSAFKNLRAQLAELEGRSATAMALWREVLVESPKNKDAEGHLLALGLAEGDLPLLQEQLEHRGEATSSSLVEAALALSDAPTARTLIEKASTDGPDLRDQEDRLRKLEEEQALHTRVGATYESLGPVSAYGPNLDGVHPFRGGAVTAAAYGRTILVPAARRPGDFPLYESGFLLGTQGSRPSSSYRLAFGGAFHSAGHLPRGVLDYERSFGSWALLACHAGLDEEADDAPFLRAVAAQSSLSSTLRLQNDLVYALAEGRLRDDRTRAFAQLGTETDQDGEIGFRLSRHGPILEAGLRLHVQQRNNVEALPAGLGRYWTSTNLSTQELPPSFAFLAAVLRVVEGDVTTRPDVARALRPHYECAFEAGRRFPERDWATGAHCAASLRLGDAGFLSADASYSWGLLAVSHAYAARFTASYTLLL